MRATDNCSENFSEGSPRPPPETSAKRRPGAPKGNRNALKHGLRTREMDAFRAEVRAHIRETRALLKWCRTLNALRKEMRC